MKEEQLHQIKERVNKATEGPWGFDKGKKERMDRRPAVIEVFVPEHNEWFINGDISNLEDAEFIAHAREDVPNLVSEIERLKTELTIAGNDKKALKSFVEETGTKHGDLNVFLQQRTVEGLGKHVVDAAMGYIQKLEQENERKSVALKIIMEDEAPYCDEHETLIHATARKALEGETK